MIDRRRFLLTSLAGAVAAPLAAEGQQPHVYQVGVIHHGGAFNQAVTGLQDGLEDLGLEGGKQYVLHEHDAKGDFHAVKLIASRLESAKVDVICAFATSVTLSAKQATKRVPIVFHSGSDPVASGLVESFRRPGGRLTGFYSQAGNLTPKRLEILKQMIPRLRRVMVFYNPDNPAGMSALKDTRAAARQLKLTIVERAVHSVDELRAALPALRADDVDAYFHASDALMTSHADLIIEAANAKKLPVMFQNRDSVIRGALAGYGLNYYTTGRLTAKYVQRVLLGADPGELPIEHNDTFHLIINLKTAKALGLTIPPSVLARADEVIE